MAIDAPETDRAPFVAPATVRSRRALLTAAIGGLGGLFASRLGAPAPAIAAAGDPLVLGIPNSAGSDNTTLTTASTGTALLVTQTGTGTALRGSAVGPGSIAGFFTAANGPGISGVTASPNTYGVFGSNDGAAGTGGAIRANGKNNHGVVASTDSASKVAVKATNSVAGGTAGLFENTNGGAFFNSGPAIRAYTAGGSNNDVHPVGTEDNDAAGEFAGVTGVIAASTGNGSGLLARSVSGAGVYAISTSGFGVLGQSETGYAIYAAGRAAVGTYLDMFENAAPVNPPINTARLFVRDNGGKTELCVLFPTGAIQVIKTEA